MDDNGIVIVNAKCRPSTLAIDITLESFETFATTYAPAGICASPTVKSNGTLATICSSARATDAPAIAINAAAPIVRNTFPDRFLMTSSLFFHQHAGLHPD
jgi:hypothetical protein